MIIRFYSDSDEGQAVLLTISDSDALLNISALASHLGIPIATMHAWVKEFGVSAAIKKAKQKKQQKAD